ncbi:MAG: hypothetical protein ACTS27_08950 [Phycisphaerales bacterium]
MQTRSARLTIRALLACLAFLPATTAVAAPPPEGVVAKTSLTQADRTAIVDWTRTLADALRTGDPAAVSAAREDLIRALTQDTSVPFRLEVSGTLVDTLRTLGNGNDEIRAFNAFQIAGALATDAATDLLTAALRDDSSTIRYGGALGSRILFQQFIAGRSPLTQDDISAHLRDLASALASEQDPVVAEGLMTSFGVQFPSPSARAQALRLMDDAVGARIKAVGQDPAWTRAVVRAVDSSRRLLLDQQVAGQRDAEFARAAATLAGHGMAYAIGRLESAQGAERTAVGDLLKASEVTLLLTGQQLGASGMTDEQPIAQAWERGNDTGVRSAAQRWIGQNGLLYRAPFNLPANSLNN